MRTAWVVIVAFFGAMIASAHGVDLLVLPEGSQLVGHAAYEGGSPVSKAEVSVIDSEGAIVDTLLTDEEGRFSYTPDARGDYTFVVKTADGHYVETKATATMGGPAESHVEGDDSVRQIVQEEIAPVRVQLDALERKYRFRDILGGIGYIVGIVGLMAWVQGRRRNGRA